MILVQSMVTRRHEQAKMGGGEDRRFNLSSFDWFGPENHQEHRPRYSWQVIGVSNHLIR